MKKINVIILACWITTMPSFFAQEVLAQRNNSTKLSKWEYYDGTEQSIRKYFDDNLKELDPIEGVFTLSHTVYDSYGSLIDQKDNIHTIAIVKDKISLTREFIEINLQQGNFPKYAITAEFTKSSNGRIYLSKQFSQDRTSSNENFVWDNELGMLVSEKTEYYKGNKFTIKRYYLKIYPKANPITKSKANSKSHGTCFAISKEGYFLTNFHVIENGGNVSIFLKHNLEVKEFKADVVLKDEINDIAVLKIADKDFTNYENIPYRLIENSKIGENIFTMGYPISNIMGENLKYTNGSISALSGIKDDIRFYQISAPIQPGNSGGPLFNINGDIIGITTAKLNSQAVGIEIQNVNYAIKAIYINNVLKMLPFIPEILFPEREKNQNSEQNLVESLSKYIGIIICENK
ncbi:MAG: S1C family serine protease [Sphingobacteriaceae bacterium]|nr:S1C family serine protease [Sphingobacteriaceae bacterium]